MKTKLSIKFIKIKNSGTEKVLITNLDSDAAHDKKHFLVHFTPKSNGKYLSNKKLRKEKSNIFFCIPIKTFEVYDDLDKFVKTYDEKFSADSYNMIKKNCSDAALFTMNYFFEEELFLERVCCITKVGCFLTSLGILCTPPIGYYMKSTIGKYILFGGFSGSLGLGCFYHTFCMGPPGITTPNDVHYRALCRSLFFNQDSNNDSSSFPRQKKDLFHENNRKSDTAPRTMTME